MQPLGLSPPRSVLQHLSRAGTKQEAFAGSLTMLEMTETRVLPHADGAECRRVALTSFVPTIRMATPAKRVGFCESLRSLRENQIFSVRKRFACVCVCMCMRRALQTTKSFTKRDKAFPLKNEAKDFFHRDGKELSSRWKLFFTAMRNDCHRDEKSLRVEGTGKTHYKIVLEETLKVYISRTSVFTNI